MPPPVKQLGPARAVSGAGGGLDAAPASRRLPLALHSALAVGTVALYLAVILWLAQRRLPANAGGDPEAHPFVAEAVVESIIAPETIAFVGWEWPPLGRLVAESNKVARSDPPPREGRVVVAWIGQGGRQPVDQVNVPNRCPDAVRVEKGLDGQPKTLFVLARDLRCGYLMRYEFEQGAARFVYDRPIACGSDRNQNGTVDMEWSFVEVAGGPLPEGMLVSVFTGHDRDPRGYYLVDPATGRVLWDFPTAPSPGPVAKLGGLLLIGGYYPANGRIVRGHDDNTLMLTVLDVTGHLVSEEPLSTDGPGRAQPGFGFVQVAKPERSPGRAVVLAEFAASRSGVALDVELAEDRTGVVVRGWRPTRGYPHTVRTLDDKVLLADYTEGINATITQRPFEVRPFPWVSRCVPITIVESPRLGEVIVCRDASRGALLVDREQRVLAAIEVPLAGDFSCNCEFLGDEILLSSSSGIARYRLAPNPLFRRLLARRDLLLALALGPMVALIAVGTLISLRERSTSRILSSLNRDLRDAYGTLEAAQAQAIAEHERAARAEQTELLAGQMAHEVRGEISPLMLALDTFRQALPGASEYSVLEALIIRAYRDAPCEADREALTRLAAWAKRCDPRGPLPAQVDALQGVGARIGELVESVLDYARIAKDIETAREQVDLARIAGEVVLSFGADRAALDGPAQPVTVLGHALRLRQVVRNLVQNGIDATEARTGAGPRPPVRVTVSLAGDDARLSVSDEGIGMSEAQLARLFTPLATTKPTKGHGLGLAISQRIVEGHGGRIEVQSALGRGTTFLVVLRSVSGGT